MITQQAQIKLNLPLQLKTHIENKANKLGVPLASYIKHLIINDVVDMVYPTFKMSDRSESKLKEAMEQIDQAVDIDNVHEYFKK
jgi:predicted DNA-binding protein